MPRKIFKWHKVFVNFDSRKLYFIFNVMHWLRSQYFGKFSSFILQKIPFHFLISKFFYLFFFPRNSQSLHIHSYIYFALLSSNVLRVSMNDLDYFFLIENLAAFPSYAIPYIFYHLSSRAKGHLMARAHASTSTTRNVNLFASKRVLFRHSWVFGVAEHE